MCHAGITIESAGYTVSEAEGGVEVCAVQNGQLPIGGNVVATLSTVALSGPAGATGTCVICLFIGCVYLTFPLPYVTFFFHTLLHVQWSGNWSNGRVKQKEERVGERGRVRELNNNVGMELYTS